MNTDTQAPSRPTQQSQPRQPDTRPGGLEYFVGKAYLNRAFDFDGKTANIPFLDTFVKNVFSLIDSQDNVEKKLKELTQIPPSQ